MKVWCYDDAHHWGTSLLAVAKERGHDARLFDRPTMPDEGFVFVHMHAHPAVREHHKRLMEHFAINPKLRMVPSYREAMLYDDKLEQLRQLAKWMPPTLVIRSPAVARDYVDALHPSQLPIVSKSIRGSGVRLLKNLEECKREIKQAFSDLGIKNRHGDRSHGHLYWQEYAGPHDHTIRVLIIGSQFLVARRGARLADADARIEPVNKFDAETESAVSFASNLATVEGFRFCGLDLIGNEHKGWKLLKLTVGWQVRKYFDARFVPGQEPGTRFWHVLIEEMEKGNCG